MVYFAHLKGLLCFQNKQRLTTGQVVGRLFCDSWGQLLCISQVLEDVNVRGQKCHVLLTTSIWHPQQPIQVLQGSTQNVTCTETLTR